MATGDFLGRKHAIAVGIQSWQRRYHLRTRERNVGSKRRTLWPVFAAGNSDFVRGSG
jgi:hypothetical protein